MHHTKASKENYFSIFPKSERCREFLHFVFNSMKAFIVCYTERLCGRQVFDEMCVFAHGYGPMNNCKWTCHSLTGWRVMDAKLTSNQWFIKLYHLQRGPHLKPKAARQDVASVQRFFIFFPAQGRCSPALGSVSLFPFHSHWPASLLRSLHKSSRRAELPDPCS